MKNKILSCYRNLKVIYSSLNKFKLLANINEEKRLLSPYITHEDYNDLVTIENVDKNVFKITLHGEEIILNVTDGIDYLVSIMPRIDLETAAMFLNHASECGRFITAAMPYVAIDQLNQVPQQERYTTDAAISQVSPKSAVTALGYSENVPVSRQMAAEGEEEEIKDGQKQKKDPDDKNEKEEKTEDIEDTEDTEDTEDSDDSNDNISDEELDELLADIDEKDDEKETEDSDKEGLSDEDLGELDTDIEDEEQEPDYSNTVSEGSVLQDGNSVLTVTTLGKNDAGKDVALLSNNTELTVEELENKIKEGEWQKVASSSNFKKIVAETLDSNILYYNQLMLMKTKVIERLSKINQALRWVETRKSTVDSASPEYSQITKDEAKFKEDLKYYTNIIEKLKDKIVDYQSLQSRINIEREVDLQEFYGLLGIENIQENTLLPDSSEMEEPDIAKPSKEISEEEETTKETNKDKSMSEQKMVETEKSISDEELDNLTDELEKSIKN